MQIPLRILRTAYLAAAAALLLAGAPALMARGDPEAEYVGSQACSDCHQELTTQFTQSVHSRLEAWELNGQIPGCESCHGPGGNHTGSLEKADIFSYGEAAVSDIEGKCMSCHAGGMGQLWAHAEHSMQGVTCTDCHAIHQARPVLPGEPGFIERTALRETPQMTPPRRASLKKDEAILCMECHRQVGSRFMMPSHHPVREGKLNCSSCHQVHGSEVGLLDTAERVNSLCVECHTSKQGPFIFDHQPVTEDCTTCHVPHGSVADNLLKQNEPFLCLQCHEAHFHIGREGISDPISRPTGSVSNQFGEAGWRIAFGTKCTQCHQAVHGSDLPSQSVTSQGKSLTR